MKQMSFADAEYAGKRKQTRRERFRGLAKNIAQQTTLFALSNLWMVRNRLMGMGEVRL